MYLDDYGKYTWTSPTGNMYHYHNGKLHREDGPAIEYEVGLSAPIYALHGQEMSRVEWKKKVKCL
jgi:hypothetical protein